MGELTATRDFAASQEEVWKVVSRRRTGLAVEPSTCRLPTFSSCAYQGEFPGAVLGVIPAREPPTSNSVAGIST